MGRCHLQEEDNDNEKVGWRWWDGFWRAGNPVRLVAGALPPASADSSIGGDVPDQGVPPPSQHRQSHDEQPSPADSLLSSQLQAMLSDWLHQESLHWNLDKLFRIKSQHLASWEEASRTQNASHTTSDCKLTVTVVRGDWVCQKYDQLLWDLRSIIIMESPDISCSDEELEISPSRYSTLYFYIRKVMLKILSKFFLFSKVWFYEFLRFANAGSVPL